ncbi:hypothetical protein Tco_0557188 [Tanacetum coccineum]
MSPLDLQTALIGLPASSIEIEGIFKIQPIAGVDDTILSSLGWSNLEFLNNRRVGTYDYTRGPEGSRTQVRLTQTISALIQTLRNTVSITIIKSSPSPQLSNFALISTRGAFFPWQMYYELGIFSTIYGGKVMPTWIRRRRKGPSISFTIPSSPNKLRGLNLSYVQTLIRPYGESKVPILESE